MTVPRTRRNIGIGAVLTGVVLFAFGIRSVTNARMYRNDADEHLISQTNAHMVFQRDAKRDGQRLQSGKIDDAGWARESEATSTGFQSRANAAGTAWTESLDARNHSILVSLVLFLCGGGAIVTGVILLLVDAMARKRAPIQDAF